MPRSLCWKDEYTEYMHEICPGRLTSEVTRLLNEKFGTNYTKTQIEGVRKRLELSVGKLYQGRLLTREQHDYLVLIQKNKISRDVANEMKEEYDFSLATIFDFETHGENWNEANQLKLSQFKQVDFVKYAYPKYEHMGQLRDYQRFLLENTDLAYFFYDPENETKLKFIDNLMKNQEGYRIKRLTFEDLNELAENFSEK